MILQEMIIHICGPTSGFFIHIIEKKDIARNDNSHLQVHKWFFNIHIGEYIYCTFGSKWHIISECVYFAFKTIVFLGVLYPQKHAFPKRNFQLNFFETFYIVFVGAPICYIFFYNQIWRNMSFWMCTNFPRFCVLSWKFVIISNQTKTC